MGLSFALDGFDLETTLPPRGAYPYKVQADPSRPQHYFCGARNGGDGIHTFHDGGKVPDGQAFVNSVFLGRGANTLRCLTVGGAEGYIGDVRGRAYPQGRIRPTGKRGWGSGVTGWDGRSDEDSMETVLNDNEQMILPLMGMVILAVGRLVGNVGLWGVGLKTAFGVCPEVRGGAKRICPGPVGQVSWYPPPQERCSLTERVRFLRWEFFTLPCSCMG